MTNTSHPRGIRVSGIDVPHRLIRRWRSWLAPDPQPFFSSPTGKPSTRSADGVMTPELRDTFRTWKIDRGAQVTWLSERMFRSLDRDVRAALLRQQVSLGRGAVPVVRRWEDLLDPKVLRAQGDGRRFVWWPSLLGADAATILERAVSQDRLRSRHAEVPEEVWGRCSSVLPRARELAGTFPEGSGPNCFGTVMASCGHRGVADGWVLQRSFQGWLDERTRKGGDDSLPGTVLLWRDAERCPQHAAITIGDGWALEKPSQEWHSARVVLDVRDLIKANRVRGMRLERHFVDAAK